MDQISVLAHHCAVPTIPATSGQLQYALLSQFQGALLGLALSSMPFAASAQGEKTPSEHVKISLWELSLGMLRYHDSWEYRWQWLTAAVSADDLTVVQALIMGDLLEQILCNFPLKPLGSSISLEASPEVRAGLSSFTHLENRLSRYDLPAEAQRYYQNVFANIVTGLSPEHSQDAFISGVLCGLHYSQSYGLAIQRAAQFGGVAPLVAGLLAGAQGSQTSLPVLWQLSDSAIAGDRPHGLAFNYSEVMAIASSLFDQWAGVLLA